MKKPNPKAPRKKGDARKPRLTSHIAAGLVRLPELIPISAAADDPNIQRACAYLVKLVRHFNATESQRVQASAKMKTWRNDNPKGDSRNA